MTTKTKPTTTDAAGEVALIKELLLWARKERIAIGTVSVGSVCVDVTNMALADPRPVDRSDAAAAANLYERYGGELLDESMKEGEEETTALEEDDD